MRSGIAGRPRRRAWPEKSKNSKNASIGLKERTVHSRLSQRRVFRLRAWYRLSRVSVAEAVRAPWTVPTSKLHQDDSRQGDKIRPFQLVCPCPMRHLFHLVLMEHLVDLTISSQAALEYLPQHSPNHHLLSPSTPGCRHRTQWPRTSYRPLQRTLPLLFQSLMFKKSTLSWKVSHSRPLRSRSPHSPPVHLLPKTQHPL